MKKHPEAIAWQKWLNSTEGQKCCEGTAQGEYLKNRLASAFSAAWKACVNRLEEPEEEPNAIR